MTLSPAALLLGFAVLSPTHAGQAASARPSGARLLLAQTAEGTGTSFPSMPDAGAGVTMPGSAPAAPAGAPAMSPPAQNGAPSAAGTPPASTTGSAQSTPLPAPTGATRNGASALPTLAQPSTGLQGSGSASITFGGPRVDVQPVYGSTLRDNGAGNGGNPTYSSAPGTLGGPINGTANNYYPTLPNGAAPPGQSTTDGRGTRSQNGSTLSTQQPLGGAAYTRDQTGTFGARVGYDAQGVYNSTAVPTGNGYGYGPGYVTTGRPTGGLLSTGVDATGPLRPYIPLNTGPIGRPNSGYGVPNGSRSTHMDGRGIQRVD